MSCFNFNFCLTCTHVSGWLHDAGVCVCVQVRNLLHKRIQNMYLHPQFQTDVIKPLRIDELMDQEVQHLSGGELQRVAITMCLGKEADLYLIDEPSAYLDSEQRIIAAKVSTVSSPGGTVGPDVKLSFIYRKGLCRVVEQSSGCFRWKNIVKRGVRCSWSVHVCCWT